MAGQSVPFGMFLQDPSVSDLTDDYQFPIDTDYLDGMSSSKFIIQDADEQGLPLFPGLYWPGERDLSYHRFKDAAVDNPQFHQVNVFAVASHTLKLVEEELGMDLVWRSGGPLVIRPHAFEGANAYYDPGSPSLNFGYFTSSFRRTPIWTCLSHDVVAHELGHAVLDNFRPLYSASSNLDTGAIHESIGDLLALFSALEHLKVVSEIYEQTGGDMYSDSLITGLGEEFGIGVYGAMVPFLRSALYGPPYDEYDPMEVHDRSTIWTAAIYEILAKLVDLQKPRNDNEFFAAITEASHWIKGMLIRAFHYTPTTGLTMPVFARLIYLADERVFPTDSKFRDIAKKVFEDRNLWDTKLDFSAPNIGTELEAVSGAGPTALAKFVVDHATELRIPLGAGGSLLNPRLFTVTRTNDTQTDAKGKSKTIPITEHYLNYAYETILAKVKEDGVQVIVTYYGGTLVLSENWEALYLVTDPVVYRDDEPGPEGTKAAIQRDKAKFESLRRRLGCPMENNGTSNGWPFRVEQPAVGPARLVRKRCNLKEHMRGVARRGGLLPFATKSLELPAMK